MDSAPSACRPEAMARFRSALAEIQTTGGLVLAAAAIAAQELPVEEVDLVPSRLAGLAAAIRGRVRGDQPAALLAHAHQFLFEEQGFRGNSRDYYDPHNSYLPSVLSSRTGIPITLTLVYKAVLEELGIPVTGIAAPGHFLAQVEVDGRPAFVDPFGAGALLRREEAFARLDELLGRSVPRSDDVLPAASHRTWLQRMLKNLQGVFRQRNRRLDLHAMLELELELSRTAR